MMEKFKQCAVGGCGKNAHWTAKGARGWCYSHYGTRAAGERHGAARLSFDDVSEIRRLKGVVLQRVLAERFGVTQPNISAIQRGVSWSAEG